MAKDKIKAVLTDVANLMKEFTVHYLTSQGKYPLQQSSDLVKSINFKVEKDYEVSLYANYYAKFVNSGRKKQVTKIPVQILINWIKKRKIRGRNSSGKYISTNTLAYIFQNSIYKKGIKAKPFIKEAFNFGGDVIDEYIEAKIFDDIADDLIKYFQKGKVTIY